MPFSQVGENVFHFGIQPKSFALITTTILSHCAIWTDNQQMQISQNSISSISIKQYASDSNNKVAKIELY